ncbi:hypothetical protein KC19_2G057200 [Ceratodon purpureus]|uniref:Aminotransferase class I/classII large domain-containing protein n=1 Tax=Ceratodon purpureus TaxID=3225 RepID=A0A8T0ISM8_CERPU|nr:hypothetical protein KC19_2G057200 [Ceratodon purpureus]
MALKVVQSMAEKIRMTPMSVQQRSPVRQPVVAQFEKCSAVIRDNLDVGEKKKFLRSQLKQRNGEALSCCKQMERSRMRFVGEAAFQALDTGNSSKQRHLDTFCHSSREARGQSLIQRTIMRAGTELVATEGVAAEVDYGISPRFANVKSSQILDMLALANELDKADPSGVPIIRWCASESGFDTPRPIVEEGMKALQDGFTRYTDSAGILELRQAICHKLQVENGLTYALDEILVSNGAKQSLMQAVTTVCLPGDEVIIPTPYWAGYPEMVHMAEAKTVTVETSIDNNFMLTANALSAVLTDKSRLLIINTPANPTGTVYTRKALEAIAAVVVKHPRLLVLSDEIFEHIIYSPATHTSIASIPGMWERTLTVNGFSKVFAMTGWRLGYLAAPRKFLKPMAKIQSQSTSGACSIAQKAGVAALGLGHGGGKEVAAMVKAYEERKDFLVQRLQALEGVKVFPPEGTFDVFPDFSAYFGTHVAGFGTINDAETLCRFFMKTAKVAMVPGDCFGNGNCIRISFGSSMEKIKEGMERIESVMPLLKPSTLPRTK